MTKEELQESKPQEQDKVPTIGSTGSVLSSLSSCSFLTITSNNNTINRVTDAGIVRIHHQSRSIKNSINRLDIICIFNTLPTPPSAQSNPNQSPPNCQNNSFPSTLHRNASPQIPREKLLDYSPKRTWHCSPRSEPTSTVPY